MLFVRVFCGVVMNMRANSETKPVLVTETTKTSNQTQCNFGNTNPIAITERGALPDLWLQLTR